MRYKIFALVMVAQSLAACGLVENVKPWDRDILAQEPMLLDANPMFNLMDEKIYFSREGARGGAGVGGGGCGCN
ncbi:MAG: DUF4266 domain-containing protein [Gammaproteobacteria bacterium]|nr:DUF4266 domain-containing protein [Gammaproteobacteria bacterium]